MADDKDLQEDKPATRANAELAEWVMGKVNRWRETRDSNYSGDWSKYDRIFRGKWDPSLKNKSAERSKLITPATQSAVDQTVAEMSEAVFGRGDWFDLTEEAPAAPAPHPQASSPGQPPPAQGPTPEQQAREEEELVRTHLLDDFANSRLISDVIATFYNGAKFGTGISKRQIDTKLDGTQYVCWVPVKPDEFVIDTAAKTIDEALGGAFETIRPLHEIKEKQQSGAYYDEEVSSATGYSSTDLLKGSLNDMLTIDPQDGIYITEYHGKVPTNLLHGKPENMEESDESDMLDDDTTTDVDDDKSYTEAIVIIANGATLLSAEENALKDRGFIAYQHHRDPDSFWGIGVIEKAFNSQSGLDGEVRARMDALALLTYPIVGIDATRMPRNLDMAITPGKIYRTNGEPGTIIQPITFGALNNASFQQSGDMERYVQVATGATDPAKPVNGNSTASGQSQQSSAFIKRAKLTMQSVDEFLSALIRKSIIAYNALNPQRYPKIPYFTVNATMSIMAREFEQMQMTNLLAIIPQQSPAFPIVLKGIIESYSGPSKDKIIDAIEQSMKPDPAAIQAQQHTQQIQLQTMQAALDKALAEVEEVKSRAGLNSAKTQTEGVKGRLAPMQMQIQAAQAQTGAKTADTQARQLEVEAAKVQLDHHHRGMDHLHKKVSNAIALHKVNQPKQSAGEAA